MVMWFLFKKNRCGMLIWASNLVGWWHFHLLANDLLHICIYSFLGIMIVISDFLQNLNPLTRSGSSWDVILYYYLAFLYYYDESLIIVLPCFNLNLIWISIARTFIMLDILTENGNKTPWFGTIIMLEILVELLL